MMNIVVKMTLRAVDESDLSKIAYELRKRIETQPSLQTDNIKIVLVTSIEHAPVQVLTGASGLPEAQASER